MVEILAIGVVVVMVVVGIVVMIGVMEVMVMIGLEEERMMTLVVMACRGSGDGYDIDGDRATVGGWRGGGRSKYVGTGFMVIVIYIVMEMVMTIR